jgi:hypothetical protein
MVKLKVVGNKKLNWKGTDKVCIKIQQAEYIHYSEILNPKEKKHLIDFLKSKNKYFSDKTNWQVLVVQWSMNNADFELSPETKMPDYQNL